MHDNRFGQARNRARSQDKIFVVILNLFSSHRYSFIHYTLGDFICYGKRGLYPSEAGDADFLFKAAYTGGLVVQNG